MEQTICSNQLGFTTSSPYTNMEGTGFNQGIACSQGGHQANMPPDIGTGLAVQASASLEGIRGPDVPAIVSQNLGRSRGMMDGIIQRRFRQNHNKQALNRNLPSPGADPAASLFEANNNSNAGNLTTLNRALPPPCIVARDLNLSVSYPANPPSNMSSITTNDAESEIHDYNTITDDPLPNISAAGGGKFQMTARILNNADWEQRK
jgi:hypothetical protein